MKKIDFFGVRLTQRLLITLLISAVAVTLGTSAAFSIVPALANHGGDLYGDADNDGYGDPGDSIPDQETHPFGYVTNDQDCDDTDPSVNPAAPRSRTASTTTVTGRSTKERPTRMVMELWMPSTTTTTTTDSSTLRRPASMVQTPWIPTPTTTGYPMVMKCSCTARIQ